MNTPPDPDLEHLKHLLDFLPGPDDREFWTLVDGKGHSAPTDDQLHYVLNKLVGSLLALRTPEPSPTGIVSLVQYLMMFFGGDHPGLHQLMDQRMSQIPLPPGQLGRYWVEDLKSTCWRLYVRYHANGSWATKWPEDVHAWREQEQ